MHTHDGQQADTQPDTSRLASLEKESRGDQQEKQRQPHRVVGSQNVDGEKHQERKHQCKRSNQFGFFPVFVQPCQQKETDSGESKVDHSHDREYVPAKETHYEGNDAVEQQHAAQEEKFVFLIPFIFEKNQIERSGFLHCCESLLPERSQATLFLSHTEGNAHTSQMPLRCINAINAKICSQRNMTCA